MSDSTFPLLPSSMTLSSAFWPILLAYLAALLAFGGLKLWRLGSREKGLPPGPPTKWGFGNAAMFPEIFKSLDWGKEYGDLYSLKVFGSTVVILNHPSAIKAILDKQGLITGNRAEFHIGQQLIPDMFLAANMDSPVWKAGRKAAHVFLHEESIRATWPTHEKGLVRFLNDVLDSPQQLCTHINQSSLSTSSVHLYGTSLPENKSPKSQEYFAVARLVDQMMDPSVHPPVDFLPILKYIPERFAKWKRVCRSVKLRRKQLYDQFFWDGEKALGEGEPTGSCLERLYSLRGGETWGNLDMREAVPAFATMMDAGVDTVAAFIQTSLLALLNHPECLRRIQMEVDGVVGDERFPALEDLHSLPYLHAFIKEVHRFRPLVPFGVPHVASRDARYEDYVIPAGSMIMPNLWAIFNDTRFFDKPDAFDPERYMKSRCGLRLDIDASVDVECFRDNLPFGAGRRICPGEGLASRMISTHLLYIVWAFDLSKDDSDVAGIDMDSFYPFQPGHSFRPKPFTCRVTPRNQKRAALAREGRAQASA